MVQYYQRPENALKRAEGQKIITNSKIFKLNILRETTIFKNNKNILNKYIYLRINK